MFFPMWEDYIESALVNTFFSHFEHYWLSDFLFILLSLFFIIDTIISKPKHNQTKDYIISCAVILLFWGYYRFCSQRFDFYSLIITDYVKYIDLVAIYVICYFIRRSKKTKESCFDFKDGFEIDTPIESLDKKDDDMFNRKGFAEGLVEKLLNTNTTKESFSFGIVSQWGSGKTTFMNFMKKIIKDKHTDCLVIDFNPWLYTNKANIISLFFDEMSKILKPFDNTLANGILDYSKALSTISTTETKIASTIVDLISPSSKLEDKINLIDKSIKTIKRKIVVFVDDIDRLESNEIMEVLKLIRNISNFPYMYFVVAYDKEYLLNSLKDKMTTKSLGYTEKIFQVEFMLPQCDKQKIKDNLYKLISPNIENDEQKELYDTLFSMNNIVDDVIATIRDVKRIANSFKTSYLKLKGEIKVSDLFHLELLKIKFSSVYSILERDRKYVLASNHYKCYELFDEYNVDKSNIYDIIVNEERYNLKTYIKNNEEQLHLKETDIKIIESLLNSLFPSHSINTSERSINNVLYTDRYFSLSLLESDISDKEFDDLLQNNEIDKIKTRFKEWIENKSNALSAKITSFQPKNKEERKLQIRLLLFLISDIDSIQYFITENLLNLADFNEDKKLTNEDRLFIKESLCENGYNIGLGQYLYMIGYNSGCWDYPLSIEELNEVKQLLFKDCVTKYSDDVSKVVQGFYAASDFEWENGYRKYSYLPQNVELMRKYVERNAVFSIFIKYTIIFEPSQGGQRRCKLNGLPVALWKSLDNYISYIKSLEEPSALINEYLDFVEKYKAINKEEYINYSFKHIIFE